MARSPAPRLHGRHRLRPGRPRAQRRARQRRDAALRPAAGCRSSRARSSSRAQGLPPAARSAAAPALRRRRRARAGARAALVNLLFDAETSGGLLIVVARGIAPRALERELGARAVRAERVGEVVPAEDARVVLEP